MRISDHRYNFSLRLLYTGFYKVGSWWNYQNVVSPFSRLYLITEGQACIYMNNKKYILTPGKLFLIPSFTLHSYGCDNFMEHYYVCFSHEIAGFPLYSTTYITDTPIVAKETDCTLIKRLISLNTNKSLPSTDPQKYNHSQNSSDNRFYQFGFATEIESCGILLQLFSRFMSNSCNGFMTPNHYHEKFEDVINYIHNNLNQRILISELSGIMHNTPDYFSKIFKKIFGISPSGYIQQKRIEKAQLLLFSSTLTIKEIAEIVGIPNLSQFSKSFSNSTLSSPRKYRVLCKNSIII